MTGAVNIITTAHTEVDKEDEKRPTMRLLRRRLDGATQLRNRVVKFVQVEQGLTQGTMSTGKLRINRNRLPERHRRRLQLPFLYERHSQIVGRIEIGGIELQSSLQSRDSGIHLSGMGLRHAEVKEGKRVIRAELNSFLQFGHRLGKHVEMIEVQALQIMSRDRIGLGLDNTLQSVNRLLIAAVLAVGDGVRNQLVGDDAVFRVRQIAAADSWITAAGKSRIS